MGRCTENAAHQQRTLHLGISVRPVSRQMPVVIVLPAGSIGVRRPVADAVETYGLPTGRIGGVDAVETRGLTYYARLDRHGVQIEAVNTAALVVPLNAGWSSLEVDD